LDPGELREISVLKERVLLLRALTCHLELLAASRQQRLTKLTAEATRSSRIAMLEISYKHIRLGNSSRRIAS